jgi:isoleucyl-tRNA synthetase
VKSLTGDQLAQMEYQHPFCARTGKLYAADFVDNSTGTGFVHIAPGHGMDDYLLGRAVGLPIYSPVNDDGALDYTNDLAREEQMPAELVGKSILEKHGKSDANVAVIHELRVRNLLMHQENYHHSYPHCWRSKTPIIFRAMDQWFIRIDYDLGEQTFRQMAKAAIDAVQWIPDWGKNRIEAAVSSRPDWCISRQRTWGVPIPAFYDSRGDAILDGRVVRAAADLIEKHGSNVWFEKTAAELWELLKPAGWNGLPGVTKAADTLDVWIDSGSSSRAVLRQRKELQREGAAGRDLWQADMYLEGSDQHRGWFQSSLLLSLAGNGAPPYKTVLTHGFMVDADREKISKSKQGAGGYEKPQTADAYVKKYGADVVRLWVASQDYRNDIVVSDERINKVSETYRALRNTLRFQLSNLFDFDPAKNAIDWGDMTGLDRWVLRAFADLDKEVFEAYQRYEFHVVYQKISQFAAVELSSIYHDLVKDRLYTDSPNSLRRRSTQCALHHMVQRLCQMLSPILMFTTDEAWEFIPGTTASSVHLTDWKLGEFPVDDEERELWKTLFSVREQILPALEKARQMKTIGKALDAKVVFTAAAESCDILVERSRELQELLNVSQLKVECGEDGVVDAVIEHAEGQKCERCWHWELDIGVNAAFPMWCGRCAKAVG